MPNLASRTDHETETAAVLLLYLQELEDVLRAGQQPDWLQWTTRLSAALGVALAATYLEAAEQLVGDFDGWLNDGQDMAQQWGQRRADWVAASMATTTRNNVYAAESIEQLAYDFSPARADTVAITETTEAISQGEHYGAAELAAIAILLIPVWDTEDDDKVCPLCGPYERQRQNVWQGDFPTGPPAHPNCRCRLSWLRV